MSPDKQGRTWQVIDGKRVRRVAPDLRKRSYRRGSPIDRAMARAVPNASGCWIWNGALTTAGYGHLNVGGGRFRMSHVVIWEERHGPVPAGLELDHLCRVRSCCNPDHLEPVTHAVNVQRGQSAVRRCDHPDSDFYRRKATGAVVYCRTCRRERRRSA